MVVLQLYVNIAQNFVQEQILGWWDQISSNMMSISFFHSSFWVEFY